MAKEIMHHLVVGDDSFEIVDNGARERLDGHDNDIADAVERIDGHDIDIDDVKERLDGHDTAIDNVNERLDGLIVRLALTRDNVNVPHLSYFAWNNAYVNVAGYEAIGVVGTRVYDATTGGTMFSWCGFDFCRITKDANGLSQVDFLIRNHNSTTDAKIKYEIYVLYKKV